ncbi:MAG: hypothetical protein LBG58_01780, partial [Planctomycetaceae bacterium]|nr:hypothetical protein [Planctomycetaceae bacterium]
MRKIDIFLRNIDLCVLKKSDKLRIIGVWDYFGIHFFTLTFNKPGKFLQLKLKEIAMEKHYVKNGGGGGKTGKKKAFTLFEIL